ncbi:MAG: hypothetical protein ACFFC7_32600, partial [Candidatus Hermodarchaeota archaeon]
MTKLTKLTRPVDLFDSIDRINLIDPINQVDLINQGGSACKTNPSPTFRSEPLFTSSKNTNG